MTAFLERRGWLHQETPIGVPAFTPLRVGISSENCYFQIDGYICRMFYIGGLSGDDPTAATWSLRATPRSEFSGFEYLTGWRKEPMRKVLTYEIDELTDSHLGVASHNRSLTEIEDMTGFSRRELTEWLQTSHTTLNRIANSGKAPRAILAERIANFSRLVGRLHAIYGADKNIIQRALTAVPADGPSALSLVLKGEYSKAATAAQYAISPRRRFKPVSGQMFLDSPMVAVEDI
jgi:hypothetical protein